MHSTSNFNSPEPVYQVTSWGDPAEQMDTQWGRLCYHHWLSTECDRWEEKWRAAWIVVHPGNEEKGIKPGSVAMFSYRRYMQIPLDAED